MVAAAKKYFNPEQAEAMLPLVVATPLAGAAALAGRPRQRGAGSQDLRDHPDRRLGRRPAADHALSAQSITSELL